MKTSLLLIVLTLGLMSMSAKALELECSTPRKNITLKLKDNKLKLDGRFPAETMVQRSKFKGDGLQKIVYVNGDKHTLNIDNMSAFNEFNDYINIKTRQGHEMTYPVTCQKI